MQSFRLIIAFCLIFNSLNFAFPTSPRVRHPTLGPRHLFNKKQKPGAIAPQEPTSEPLPPFTWTPKRAIYAGLLVSLLGYASILAPGSSPEAAAYDTELIKTILSTPFDGTVSPVFVFIFNALGIIPAVLASLLLSGSKEQRIPAAPFVFGSFVVGYFAVCPYLIAREERIDVSFENRGFGTDAFESKLTALALLGFSLYLTFYGLTGGVLNESINSYLDLFTKSKLANVSSIDFTILSLAIYDPMKEDMSRRGWDGLPAPAFCAIPVIGPAFYLLVRPPLKGAEI